MSSTAMKPVSCSTGFGIRVAASASKNTTKGSSPVLDFHSSFKAQLLGVRCARGANTRGQFKRHILRATRSTDTKEIAQNTASHKMNSIFGLFCSLFKITLGILSVKKHEYHGIIEHIERSLEMLEEVALTVQQVTKVTGNFAVEVESESPKAGLLHKCTEVVERMSKIIGRDAAIVEHQAERIENTVKTVDELVDNAEDEKESSAMAEKSE